MKNWQDSSTLLLVGQYNDFGDYKILTMKRSSQSSFMPNTRVFPGGKLDGADCSPLWLKLYKYFGISETYFDVFKNLKHQAPIYENEIENTIPKYISLRICAIRETFEECGVLLCKSVKEDRKMWASCFQVDTQQWQKRVHNDAFQFIEMCYSYDIYPDIWALHEWGNWLTPPTYKKRFDTMFYLACVPKILPLFIENTEVQDAHWDLPKELIKKSVTLEIFLPPPQFYEISRINNFSVINDLLEFAVQRSLKGSERFLSYILQTKTFRVSILPGDDLYTKEKYHKTNEEILKYVPITSTMHRIYHFKPMKSNICIQNYKYNVDHVYPVGFKSNEISKL